MSDADVRTATGITVAPGNASRMSGRCVVTPCSRTKIRSSRDAASERTIAPTAAASAGSVPDEVSQSAPQTVTDPRPAR